MNPTFTPWRNRQKTCSGPRISHTQPANRRPLNSEMKPSTMAIYSSQRRCQEAIDELWKFTVNKTREELTTSSSMRIVTHLRSDLILQCNEMELAHRNHDPGAGNEYNTASLRVNMIVKSTKDDIGQVLMKLDDKLARPTVRPLAPPVRSNQTEPYTSIDQLHQERPPPYSNSPRTQQTLHTGGRPNYVTQAIAVGQPDVRTAHHTPTPGSGIGYRRRPGTEPTLVRPMVRQQPQLTQRAPTGHPNSDIFLKRSTATPAARTSGDKWHRRTNDYPIGAAGNNITDGNSLEYGDILRCHLCRHGVWGTWPLMQAHYRDKHGYTPQRNSSPSPSSSPEHAQPRKKHNKYTPAPDENKTQQTRRNAKQSDPNIDSIRARYNKRGPPTENPPHTHRVKTQAERKIYENDIEPMKAHTYRKNQNTRLHSSTKIIEAQLDDMAPTVTDGGMAATIQRLGSLNFPPINPQNATGAHDRRGAQPKEVVTLEVEDIPVDVQQDEQTMDNIHDNNQPSTENPADARITGDLYGGELVAKSTTPEGASIPTTEHDNTGLTHTKLTPKLSKKSGSLWDSIGALATLARGISGVAQTPGSGGPQTPSGTSGMGTEAASAPENPRADNGTRQEPCGATDRHVPRQTGEQVQLAGRQTTSEYAEYNAQPPRKNFYDTENRNIRVEVRTAADPEKAIYEAILLGKVDATGSYNVDGHAESIEDLQKRLRDLQAQRIAN